MGGVVDVLLVGIGVAAHAAQGPRTFEVGDAVGVPAFPGVRVGDEVGAQDRTADVAGAVAAPVGRVAVVLTHPHLVGAQVDPGIGEAGDRGDARHGQVLENVQTDEIELEGSGAGGVAFPVVAIPGDHVVAGLEVLACGGSDEHGDAGLQAQPGLEWAVCTGKSLAGVAGVVDGQPHAGALVETEGNVHRTPVVGHITGFHDQGIHRTGLDDGRPEGGIHVVKGRLGGKTGQLFGLHRSQRQDSHGYSEQRCSYYSHLVLLLFGGSDYEMQGHTSHDEDERN